MQIPVLNADSWKVCYKSMILNTVALNTFVRFLADVFLY